MLFSPFPTLLPPLRPPPSPFSSSLSWTYLDSRICIQAAPSPSPCLGQPLREHLPHPPFTWQCIAMLRRWSIIISLPSCQLQMTMSRKWSKIIFWGRWWFFLLFWKLMKLITIILIRLLNCTPGCPTPYWVLNSGCHMRLPYELWLSYEVEIHHRRRSFLAGINPLHGRSSGIVG